MYWYLCDSEKPERIEMGVRHIDTLALRSLIKEFRINEKVQYFPFSLINTAVNK